MQFEIDCGMESRDQYNSETIREWNKCFILTNFSNCHI